MSRDYKSRKSLKTNGKNGSAFLGGFVGYALGLMSAIGIWLYLNYVPSPFLANKEIANIARNNERISVSEQSETQENPTQGEKLNTPAEKSRFDFYKILPGIYESENNSTNMLIDNRPAQPPINTPKNNEPSEDIRLPAPIQPSVKLTETKQYSNFTSSPNLPTENTLNSTAPQAKDNKLDAKYFLQAGSFKKNDDAENLKARLALLGVLASIQSIDLADKGIWYRVRVGPFARKEDIDETVASLKENGIATQFIKAP